MTCLYSSCVKYSILDLYVDDAELHCSHSDLGLVEAHVQSDLDAVALLPLYGFVFLN